MRLLRCHPTLRHPYGAFCRYLRLYLLANCSSIFFLTVVEIYLYFALLRWSVKYFIVTLLFSNKIFHNYCTIQVVHIIYYYLMLPRLTCRWSWYILWTLLSPLLASCDLAKQSFIVFRLFILSLLVRYSYYFYFMIFLATSCCSDDDMLVNYLTV